MPFGEAIKRTLHELMAADERIRVFGEDVADAREAVLANVEGKGGVFGTTHGLQRAFGLARCFNTPLAEANIVGRAVGQAHPRPAAGARDPVLRLHLAGHEQIKSEAATIRWRSNGAFTCPMVVRVPIGGYLTGGAIWHSQCGESIFAHVPGLLIAFPSRARDAAGLLRAAFRCEDPVLFLEHKHLLRQPYTRRPVPAGRLRDPVRAWATSARPGDDLTIVTWGATVEKSLAGGGAGRPRRDGIEVEVIDLRTIVAVGPRARRPSRCARTGRLLVVHEDVLTAGFGAEVAAWAAEQLLHRPRRAGPAGRPRSTPTSPTSRRSRRRSSRRSTTSSPPSLPRSPDESRRLNGMRSAPAAPTALRSNDPCWCGSGNKYKRCHKELEGRIVPGTISPWRTVPARDRAPRPTPTRAWPSAGPSRT